MSLSDFGTVKKIIRDLLEKNDRNDLSEAELDHQFATLINSISKYIAEGRYFFLFDWIIESVKREQQLLNLLNDTILDQEQKNKDILLLLVFKLKLTHAKIIEQIADEIYIAYIDFIDLLNMNEIELAVRSKVTTLGMGSSFLLFLTEHRCLDKRTFDRYIQIISQALSIFD